MTARALPEDAPPCVTPPERPQFHRVFGALSFPGGPVDTAAMPASHPGGVTPSTFVEPSRRERGLAFLQLAAIGIEEALAVSSASGRKCAIISAQGAIRAALELLEGEK